MEIIRGELAHLNSCLLIMIGAVYIGGQVANDEVKGTSTLIAAERQTMFSLSARDTEPMLEYVGPVGPGGGRSPGSGCVQNLPFFSEA